MKLTLVGSRGVVSEARRCANIATPHKRSLAAALGGGTRCVWLTRSGFWLAAGALAVSHDGRAMVL
eukprot:2696096-Prymnesium_polylepis.1